MSLVEQPPPPLDPTRVRVLMVAVAVGALILVARLWYLQIVLGDALLEESEANRTRVTRRVPPRGVITDANGKILATCRPRIVVRVMPDSVKRNPWILRRLASLLGCSEEEVHTAYQENRVDSYQPVLVASDVGLDAATRIEEHRYELPGVVVGPEPVRSYQVGTAYGHVLGYVGKCSKRDLEERAAAGYVAGDTCGKTGVEGGPYDAALRGRDGTVTVEVDALGAVQGELSSSDPVPGATLRLNIRADLQSLAYRELRRFVAHGKAAAAVAMDPTSGAVLAMVSVPSFDPGEFVGGIPRSRWDALQKDRLRPLINRTTAMAVAPGSVFKLVTATAGLDTGKASVYSSDYCRGIINLGHWPKRCHRRSGHGAVTFIEAVAKSCDVFFYHLGQRLGPDAIATYARRFGFGEKTGVDIAGGEVAGIVPDPAWKERRKLGSWVGGDTVDYAIGQAMLGCTPLQVCNAVAAIANGGTLYRPHVVGSVTTYEPDGKGSVSSVPPEPIRSLGVPSRTLATIRRAMEAVVETGGTGTRCAIPGIRVAGKTGTAQRRRRGDLVNDAWFAGYAPADNPRIAVCVYVEEGGHGGEVAAPVARTIMAHYLGVKVAPTAPGGRADD